MRYLLCFLFLVLVPSCKEKITPGVNCPEVRVKHRNSKLGKGKVLMITNSGAKPLFNVAVSSQLWKTRYVIASKLKPGETAEAGWMELPSGLRIGDVVEVFAEGYKYSHQGTLTP